MVNHYSLAKYYALHPLEPSRITPKVSQIALPFLEGNHLFSLSFQCRSQRITLRRDSAEVSI